ncbi:MAG: tetratricopeptide repeat protein, partial [Clostridia bacterium]|nr:tetratricopeptide repeat protein [Clostridia bacterium]
DREDYEEPRCVLCMEKDVKVIPIPVDRVIRKLDEYYEVNDVEGARRHLLYWLEEAKIGNDKKGEFTVRDELMGHYRKQGDKENAMENANAVADIIDELEIGDTVPAGTAYLNIGTVYKAFGKAKESLTFFDKALKIYKDKLPENDLMFGGLYNNAALSYVDIGEYEKAKEYFSKAVDITDGFSESKLDAAISYLNMATATDYEKGYKNAEKEIKELLEKAKERIDCKDVKRNGYYAFVCEKCASGFEIYGDKDYAEELKKRAKDIYERS